MATYSLPPAIGYSLPAFKQSQSGNIKVLFEYPIDFNKNNITQIAKDVKIECNKYTFKKATFLYAKKIFF